MQRFYKRKANWQLDCMWPNNWVIQLENLKWSKKRVKTCITVDDSEITQKEIEEYYFWCYMVILPGIRNSYFMQAAIIISSTFYPPFRYSCFVLLHSNLFLLAAAAATDTCMSLLSNCLCMKPNILQDLFNHFFFFLQRLLAVHSRKLLCRKILWESNSSFTPNPFRSICILSPSGKVSPTPGAGLQQELPEQVFPPQIN